MPSFYPRMRKARTKRIHVDLPRAAIDAGVREMESRLANTDYVVGEEDVLAIIAALGIEVSETKTAL